MRTIRCLVATLILAAPVAGAQVGGVCPLVIIDDVVQQPNVGPGEVFGVTAYQCASCSFKREKDMAPEYSFSAEPTVLEVTAWSVLRSGDVIEAVNGQPITTRAGAEQFTYPRVGESLIALRRSGSRTEIRVTPRAHCQHDAIFSRGDVERAEILKGAAALFYGPAAAGGVLRIYRKPRTEPVVVRVVQPERQGGRGRDTTESSTAGAYGFAISCLPSCTRARASDGAEYWKFEGYPPIAGIRPGGAAAMAGLQVGDVVLEIDGISILTEEGALRFQRAERKESLQLTVQRLGKRVDYVLKPR
jgi:membrane-associated protease RseP (regulator of RpoE activity)